MLETIEYARQETNATDFERTTKADKLHLLFDQSFPAVFISIANASLLLIAMWHDISQSKLLTWYTAIIVASATRTVLFLKYRFRRPSDDAILKLKMPYFVTLMFSAAVWGVGGLWLIVEGSAADQLVIFFFLIGMAGGAISVYSAIRPFVLTTVAIILVPTSVWFLLLGDAMLRIVAVASILFLVSCFRSTRVLSTALHQSFLLGHELHHAKTKAENMARTDYLTNLNNRGAFHELAGIQLAHCKRYKFPASLIVLDLDDFKSINDSYGHGTGDDALRHVSRLITRNTRASDICGRLGGEEFMIFLPNTDIEDAVVVAEKMRSALERHAMKTGERSLPITASFGVATGSDTLEELFALADAALYSAKKAGKNRIHRSAEAESE